MAWKRGVTNNQAGAIRKGQIREFLAPSSRKAGVSSRLHIVNTESWHDETLQCLYGESPFALFSSSNEDFACEEGEMIYLHSHEHPRCVLAAIKNSSLPENTILLNEAQRVNSKVCTGENELWTIYHGETFAYDAREGAIGDTVLRAATKPIPVLHSVELDLRLKIISNSGTDLSASEVDYQQLAGHLSRSLFNCVVTLEELLQITWGDDALQLVSRVSEVVPEETTEEEENGEEGITLPDNYRGLVDASTAIRLVSSNRSVRFRGAEANSGCTAVSSAVLRSLVFICTRDEEIFPVHRRLLRPCIALTGVVQAGRGIYRENTGASHSSSIGGECRLERQREEEYDIQIDVDACTFDRVLLYLEHEARGEDFQFDPLIAPELLQAAETLQVRGLEDACRKMLGSFEERVRRVPIRLEEVTARNEKGRLAALSSSLGKRSETILILSGMVLDITRWLPEHPGGSTIIPQVVIIVNFHIFFHYSWK